MPESKRGFDAVVPVLQGSGAPRESSATSPIEKARAIVAYLNSPKLPVGATAHDALIALLRDCGLELVEHLSVQREESSDYWDFNSFMLVRAAAPGGEPFAVIRLHNDARKDGTPTPSSSRWTSEGRRNCARRG